jgi:hypothetical protein
MATVTFAVFNQLLDFNIKSSYYEKYTAFPDALNLSKLRQYFIEAAAGVYDPTIITHTLILAYLNATYVVIDTSVTTEDIVNQYLYDDTYDLSTNNYDVQVVNVNNLQTVYNPINLANGKLCITSSPYHNKMDLYKITTKFELDENNLYSTNTIDTFKTFTYYLYDRDSPPEIDNHNQTLHMFNGKFVNSYTYNRTNSLDGTTGTGELDFEYTVTDATYAVRHLPFCSLKRIDILAKPSGTGGTPDSLIVFHEMEAPDNLTEQSFSTDLITNDHDLKYFFFNGKAKTIKDNKTVVTHTCYLSENDIATTYGYNQVKENPKIGYNKIKINPITLSSADANGNTHAFRFYILACTMTEIDLQRPDIEATKILINILNNVAIPYFKVNIVDDGLSTLTQPMSILGYYPLYLTSTDAIAHGVNNSGEAGYHTLIYDVKGNKIVVDAVDFENFDSKTSLILYRANGLEEVVIPKNSDTAPDDTKYYNRTNTDSSINVITTIDIDNSDILLRVEDINSANQSKFFDAFRDKIITDHNIKWSTMWKNIVEIKARSLIYEHVGSALHNDVDLGIANGIVPSNLKRNINHLNRIIKTSFYNLYSIIRDDVNMEINPLNLSVLDLDGSLYWIAELWIVPALIYSNPSAAKTLLDHRYQQLETAQKLALTNGFKGSRFAYSNDGVNLNNVFWNASSSVYIFNTALISINVWNYFRISQDVDWLIRKGFPILKNNADFFMSKFVLKTSKQHGVKYYTMDDIFSINSNENVNNNFMSVYLARMAIKYANEAGDLLKYNPKKANNPWLKLLDGYIFLPLTREKRIIMDESAMDAFITGGKDDGTIAHLNVLEPLIILMPYYNAMFGDIMKIYYSEDPSEAPYTMNSSSATVNFTDVDIFTNFEVYKTKISSTYTNFSMNQLMVSLLEFSQAQNKQLTTSKDYLTAYNENFAKLINTNTSLPWNNFVSFNDQSSVIRRLNDIGISSLFIVGLYTNIIGTRITGYVDSSGLSRGAFGVATRGSRNSSSFAANTKAYHPVSWSQIYSKREGVRTILTNVRP